MRWIAVWAYLPVLCASTPQPPDWVPARWQWSDARSLELLADSPVNCLLLKTYPGDFVAASAARGLVTLAVIQPGADVPASVRKALDAKVTGIVLEGDFPEAVATSAREAAAGAPVIELTTRNRMRLGSSEPIVGTYQGLWPGISVQDDGKTKAGPSGTAWIDTNTGFVRAVRAWGGATLWIANEPPGGAIVTGSRYLQAIADAAISGGRWVLAFDPDFAGRLGKRDADAMHDWQRMGTLLRYFEQHPEWRRMREFGRLAIVQDPAKGGLLSGGILDMIAVKHTPVRPVPRQELSAASLDGATMAVNVDADSLTPEQKEILRNFARGGGTLLLGPPGWKDQAPNGDSITLDKKELERLNDIWHDVNSMVGRKNLGVRLFNVSSMLSNVLETADGKTEVVHLVNYSDYPVENVTVHFLGDYKHATLLTPDGTEKKLDIYKGEEEGWGVDLDKVGICASIRLEQ
jgi:hypothetical protein